MDYTVNKLAKISGVSTRTLRYYDQIGLLKPSEKAPNGYRIYGSAEVDRLQQILFYRELELSLNEIKEIVSSPNFEIQASLQNHLKTLTQKRGRIDLLIQTVTNTIQAIKGEKTMTDNEKFEGFKQNLIDENEKKYGKEIREKYGKETVEASYAKIKGMTKKQFADVETLQSELNNTLKAALETNDPAGELAQRACELHKQWLSFYYDKYTKEYHKNLGEMYVADERFKAHYEIIAPGCAEFLRDAINIYCAD